jgi:hypothetical protein
LLVTNASHHQHPNLITDRSNETINYWRTLTFIRIVFHFISQATRREVLGPVIHPILMDETQYFSMFSPGPSPMSASNALKHGLSSKKYLPEHALEAISQLEFEFIELYQPETDNESHVVRELSVAYWQKQENDRIHSLAVENEIRISSDLFERQKLLKFHQDQAQWREFPQFGRDILARTYLGAQYFQQIWSEIASSLSHDISEMTLDQAWNAALIEKSFPNIQKINPDGWWIFARFIASSGSPDHEIKDWIVRSGPISSLSAERMANQQLLKTPDPTLSKNELLKKALENTEIWTEIEDYLYTKHLEEKALFAQTAVGMGLGDDKLMAASKLALRYRSTAQSLVDKLQRRLEALRKGREQQRYRLLQATERENRRLQKQNDRRYSPAGVELWEADQVQKYGPIPSAYESSQNKSVYETGIETQIDQNTGKNDKPQVLSVQGYEAPEQNEIQEQKTTENIFQSWPDSDFTDPWNDRARTVLGQIRVSDEAQKCCDDFRNEKIRRLGKGSHGFLGGI